FCPYLADVGHGCGWAVQPAVIPSASSELKIVWIVRTDPPFLRVLASSAAYWIHRKRVDQKVGTEEALPRNNQESLMLMKNPHLLQCRPCQALFERINPCTPKSAPFRSS